jgi:hypothetical protein
MRLLLWLFAGLFVFELLLYGLALVFHPYIPFMEFFILPAVWIGIAIGGVHSARFWSFLIGFIATAFLYAVVAWVCVAALLNIRNKTR